MAIGEFTKQEAEECLEALIELGKALSKPKLREYFGHINEIALFIERAKFHAPDEDTDENDLEVPAAA